jgi:hypothetical protein
MSKYKALLTHFSEAPPLIIDEELTRKLKMLAEKDEVKSDEVLEIIDLGVRYSMMSDLGVSSLNALWELMIKNEGKALDQALKEAEGRRAALERAE